jgi:hypothetical protein
MNATPKVVDITVTSGTGSATIAGVNLVASGLGVKAVSAAAQYDIDVTDSDGYGLTGRDSCKGNTTLRDRFQVIGTITVTITDATVDGTYSIKLWFGE